jgi:hypothetical protein
MKYDITFQALRGKDRRHYERIDSQNTVTIRRHAIGNAMRNQEEVATISL